MMVRPILILLLLAAVARARDPEVGDRVVTKYNKLMLDGDRAVDDGTVMRVFTVEKVEGKSVRVVAGKVAGTFELADVVRLDEAEDFYAAEIRRDPDKAPYAHTRRALVRRARGDIDGALADATEAIRLRPENPYFHHNRGIYLAYNKKDHAAALAEYDEAIRLESSRPGFRRNRAISRRALGDTAGALADLDEAIRIAPEDAATLLERAQLRLALKQPEKALADYDRALKLDPKDARAYSQRGYLRTSLKQAAKAVPDFDQAIKLDPKFANAYHGRGVALRARNQYGKAAADLDEALRLQPDNILFQVSRAMLWSTCTEARYRDGAKAVAAATKAVEQAGGKGPLVLEALAAALAESGDFDGAVARQQELIDLDLPDLDPADLAKRRERLALYKARKPLRMP